MVVDECHCLWDWGTEFRPAFNRVPELLTEFGIERSLWMTATLPISARAALKDLLPPKIAEVGTFDLPDQFRLMAQQLASADRPEALLRWLGVQDGPGIIFVQTRATTDRIARLLTAFGKNAVIYHAGLSSEERNATELRIKSGAPDVIVATSAFGMGMNHKYLRWVVLWQPPSSLLSLTQAIGRAGRDPSRPGKALVLWNDDDFRLMLNRAPENSVASQRYFSELNQTHRFLESKECRRTVLRRYFQDEFVNQSKHEHMNSKCRNCDNCKN